MRCPKVKIVRDATAVYDFMKEIDRPCVIKPLTGSGSELVFRCTSKKDCDKWAQVIQQELKSRQQQRLYTKATTSFIAEEFICGDEYSCDFSISNNRIEVIRLTKKIHARGKPFGTIAGYALTSYPTKDFQSKLLEQYYLVQMQTTLIMDQVHK